MRYDIRFEAAYLRAAVLLGVMHERSVPEWAESRLGRNAPLDPFLAELLTVKVELTAIREALRPIAHGVDDARVSAALLTTIGRGIVDDLTSVGRTLQHLGSLRREGIDAPQIDDAIKCFEDRLMLAHAGIAPAEAPTIAELAAWLETVSLAGHYLFVFDEHEDLAAFVAAISRKVVRDRRFGDVDGLPPRVWVSRNAASQDVVAVLNEPAARIVAREFAPMPVASTIPYPEVGLDVRLVIDSASSLALGVEDAVRVLAS